MEWHRTQGVELPATAAPNFLCNVSSRCCNCRDQFYGYLISQEALYINGVRRGFGTESEGDKADTILRCVIDLMARAGITMHGRYVGVLVKGEVQRCIAIACDDPCDPLPLPPRELIERLMEVLHTDQEPRWYTYV
ncbi:hypothetical protein LshimejAT787_0501190 [Lyophyllum shimeji]|uniref:Uncharacterized protein n=1 Tax=Lyophyllum shimeji TaxID=47721 RepID=A0A9P3PMM0_LYOSH|nr:hypothetical protein LshimejAT787_0501190 [Lyophyllum shimeji]